MDPSDSDLVQRARNGDRPAFHMLVDRHAPELFRLATLLVGNATDAWDIVQETLLGAFQHLTRFEGRSSARTWLVRILVRQIAQHRRKQGRQRMLSLDRENAGALNDRVFSSRDTSTGTDARLDLVVLLATLPEEQRQVLVLRELEGWSYDEMAQMLDVPRGTIESRLFRARQTLRGKIDRAES